MSRATTTVRTAQPEETLAEEPSAEEEPVEYEPSGPPQVSRVPTERRVVRPPSIATSPPLIYQYASAAPSRSPTPVESPELSAARPRADVARPTPVPPPAQEPVPVPESTYEPTLEPVREALAVQPSSRRVSGPGDLVYDDAERGREERFGELEQQVTETAEALQEAELEREQNFRTNEEERQRIFEENEARRDQEAMQRREAILRDIEERVTGVAPIPVPPPVVVEGELAEPGAEPGASPSPTPIPPPSADQSDVMIPEAGETASVIESMRTAACRHAEEILRTVQLERDEQARERELARAEREHLQAQAEAERARQTEEQSARIRALEEELAAVRAELENERTFRATEEAERRERERAEILERDEAMRTQIGELTNLVTEQQDAMENKRQIMDERWNIKQQWREEDRLDFQACKDSIAQLLMDRDTRAQEMAQLREQMALLAEKTGK